MFVGSAFLRLISMSMIKPISLNVLYKLFPHSVYLLAMKHEKTTNGKLLRCHDRKFWQSGGMWTYGNFIFSLF